MSCQYQIDCAIYLLHIPPTPGGQAATACAQHRIFFDDTRNTDGTPIDKATKDNGAGTIIA
jgi:hypothetical protein